MENNPLDSFVSDLLARKNLPDDEGTHQNLLEQVNDAINRALLSSLPMKQLDELEAATNNNSVSEDLIERLLKEANVDSQAVVKKAVADFEENYLKGENDG